MANKLAEQVERVKLAKMIDQSLLRMDATENDVRNFCLEAKQYQFGTVAVNLVYVGLAAKLLKGSETKVDSSIAFPLGASTLEVKVLEIRDALHKGADELDIVLNIGALRSGYYSVIREEMEALVEAAKGKTTKVILETCFLSDAEKVKACQIAEEAGVDFVKTSTGFQKGGATVEDVRLMRHTVGDKVGVKAAGGVHTIQDVLAMIEAGANRIGTSRGVQILQEMGR